MKNNSDSNSILSLYENMYGKSNSVKQVNEAVERHVKSSRPKRKRNRVRKAGKEILQETKCGQENQDVTNVVSNKTGENNNMKNKFDELYSKAINEQVDADVDFEAPMDADIDAFGGEEEDTEVTITLDRDLAQKLCEVIQAAVGDGEEEGEDLMGGEGEEDDFGDEDGFEGGIEEEGAGEDSLSTAPDGVAKMTKGSLSAGARQEIGNQTHQKGRGSMASTRPQTPKPLTHKTS